MKQYPLLGTDMTPSPKAFAIMKERGGSWAAYQNQVFDSSALGHLRFLKVGPDCTFPEPPERLPDTPTVIGWKYMFVGFVDLVTGDIG